MENDIKIRTAVNYYEKNILKKYLVIWKKYSNYKKKLKSKPLKTQSICSFGSKVIVYLNICKSINSN